MVPGPFLVARNPSLLSILLHFLHDVTSMEKRPLIRTLKMIVMLGLIPLVYSVYVLLWVQKDQNSTSSSWYLCPGYWSHRSRSTGWTLFFSSRNIQNTWSMLNLVFIPFHVTHSFLILFCSDKCHLGPLSRVFNLWYKTIFPRSTLPILGCNFIMLYTCESVSKSVLSDSSWPCGLSPARILQARMWK